MSDETLKYLQFLAKGVKHRQKKSLGKIYTPIPLQPIKPIAMSQTGNKQKSSSFPIYKKPIPEPLPEQALKSLKTNSTFRHVYKDPKSKLSRHKFKYSNNLNIP